MKDAKDLISKLLGDDPKEYKKAEVYLKNLIIRISRSSGMEETMRKFLGEDWVEDVASEIKYKILTKKAELLRKEELKISYIGIMIKNTLLDLYDKNLLSISLDEQRAEVVDVQSLTPYYKGIDSQVELDQTYNLIVSSLSDREKMVLCYYLRKYLYGDVEELKGISKDNVYKTWERTKKKINKILEYRLSESELKMIVERLLSEVCNYRSYKNSED
ncbi:sigma-70 family RNA polymerase sigma factor [Thermocrinis minervae]|uniref:RNA polymerase sigma factor, sigma-70 family n=1 Tax=Thermocrinis minervae TaxID=381751 RepID=A0A1M6Q5S1_9AQUI|nr:sigma-70 family RNA polymerase sigma factor [Thermocrinis minervae]SHK15619.1 hypothetical protein SAMN05444391_0090 [Thermocrinis minervae]